MVKQIYTEFRITHKSIEEKEDFENKLKIALKTKGYKTKTEWIKEKFRELIRK